MSNLIYNPNFIQLSLFSPIQIPLTLGYSTLVDPIDSDLLLLRWHSHKGHTGRIYARRAVVEKGKKRWIYLHKVILERELRRSLLPHELTDHIDNNSLNNQRANLRPATHPQNLRNSKLSSANKTGYKGVTYNKRDKRFLAHITANGKLKHLGSFDTPEQAYAAYCNAALEIDSVFSRLK